MDTTHDSDFDARSDPPRDVTLTRALRMVDGAEASAVVLTRLHERIVASAAEHDRAPWIEQVARPARRALPWAVMLAAASLLLALTLPMSLTGEEYDWSSALLGESSVDVSLGLPTSADAFLQESLSR
jgi:hypothetical protein